MPKLRSLKQRKSPWWNRAALLLPEYMTTPQELVRESFFQLSDYRTFGVLNFRSIGPSEYQTSDYRIVGVLDFRIIGPSEYRPWLSDYWTLGVLDFRIIGPSEYWTFGLSDLRSIGLSDHRTYVSYISIYWLNTYYVLPFHDYVSQYVNTACDVIREQ